ncbi:gamma carbonic anhydrase family protein [Peptostreptococcus russellii]|uniref:gamma carbonic anhydrase family protein n=1 Tax=Peptostreptococcus russellii TaxID=215200 RepID=UPI00162AA64C|nr:gamma carbonic anhydrase family protein [Peptostreptococcus russellii]MBC2578278.1 gamma carbonic anhydrase family protein [Peptostreptococcus russellii]
MIREYKDKKAEISPSSYIDENSSIIGDVVLEENTSVWPFASIRGDRGKIFIGKNTNVQDCAVIHNPSYIGEGVSIGHSAIVHGAKIRDNVLIGMGAIILDNADIGENCIVGAGALVTGNKKFEANTLILGSPAKAIRKLTEEEIESIRENAREYNELRLDYK